VELEKQQDQIGTMMGATKTKRILGVAALLLLNLSGSVLVHAQSEEKRAVKHLVTPTMPELAKKLNLSGTVRIEVMIAPDGTVKRSRVLGGHPVLAAEAEHAAQKSTFEPGPRETTETIDFKF
jgi:TonB family protein